MTLVQHKEGDAFTTEDFRRRASGKLIPPEQRIAASASGAESRSDFDLNPSLEKLAGADEKRPAAVLVPILDKEDGASVLFTLRTDELPNHAGQISFPGGKMDKQDANLVETAMREAREEIGLEPDYIETIGFLEDYITSTGFRVAPLVAIIREGFTIAPDESEVADVFDVPLSFLMDSANHELHTREWRGAQRLFYAIPYEKRFIWGATAGMLRNMYESLYRPGDKT